ncbi:MAG: DUF5666 domain-containing protein [Candidatus Nealsonbacteria bacterium]|nr:DUF5666 domain-containing protein [Candidatus Nealsonbacteria bacterium]
MKKYLLFLVILTIIGAGAFFGGMKYAESKTSQRFQQMDANGFGNRTGAGAINRTGGNNSNNGFVTGNIISKDDKSITVSIRDGGSKIIFYSDTTEISKFVSGVFNDLEVGKVVSVTGKTNQDGTITAQSIQVRPEMPSFSSTTQK